MEELRDGLLRAHAGQFLVLTVPKIRNAFRYHCNTRPTATLKNISPSTTTKKKDAAHHHPQRTQVDDSYKYCVQYNPKTRDRSMYRTTTVKTAYPLRGNFGTDFVQHSRGHAQRKISCDCWKDISLLSFHGRVIARRLFTLSPLKKKQLSKFAPEGCVACCLACYWYKSTVLRYHAELLQRLVSTKKNVSIISKVRPRCHVYITYVILRSIIYQIPWYQKKKNSKNSGSYALSPRHVCLKRIITDENGIPRCQHRWPD